MVVPLVATTTYRLRGCRPVVAHRRSTVAHVVGPGRVEEKYDDEEEKHAWVVIHGSVAFHAHGHEHASMRSRGEGRRYDEVRSA